MPDEVCLNEWTPWSWEYGVLCANNPCAMQRLPPSQQPTFVIFNIMETHSEHCFSLLLSWIPLNKASANWNFSTVTRLVYTASCFITSWFPPDLVRMLVSRVSSWAEILHYWSTQLLGRLFLLIFRCSACDTIHIQYTLWQKIHWNQPDFVVVIVIATESWLLLILPIRGGLPASRPYEWNMTSYYIVCVSSNRLSRWRHDMESCLSGLEHWQWRFASPNNDKTNMLQAYIM